MLRNLEAEIIRKNISKEDIAMCIGKTTKTLKQKILGVYPFTYDEAIEIHEKFFPECDFKELFKNSSVKKAS